MKHHFALIFILFIQILQASGFVLNKDSTYRACIRRLNKDAGIYKNAICEEDDGNNYRGYSKTIDRLKRDLSEILAFPQSWHNDFSKYLEDEEGSNRLFESTYFLNKRFRIISFNDNPCGEWTSNLSFIQWKMNDTTVRFQLLNYLRIGGVVEHIYSLDDTLFLLNEYYTRPSLNTYYCLKFNGDSFKVVKHAWSEFHFRKMLRKDANAEYNELIVDSMYLSSENGIIEYNRKIKEVSFVNSDGSSDFCGDEECTYSCKYVYKFSKGRMVLLRRISYPESK